MLTPVCYIEIVVIIQELRAGIKSNFNMVVERTPPVIGKTFHNTVKDLKDAEWAIILSGDPIPLDFKETGLKPSDSRIMFLNWISAVIRLMVAADEHMPDNDPVFSGTLRGYTPENWNRGLVLAKYLIRESGESRTKPAASGKSRALSAANDQIADLEFLTDEDFKTILDNPTGDDEDVDEHNFFNCARRLEEAIEEDEDSGTELPDVTLETLQGSDAHDAELAKVFTIRLPAAVNSSLSRKVRSKRALLTKKETLAFCQGLKKQTIINWGAEEVDHMRSSDTNSSSGRVMRLGLQMENEPEPGIDQDDDETYDAATQELVHKAALHIKATMTRNSAPFPNYLDACDWCGVDSNTRRFVACMEDEDDETLPEVNLKFWQPISKRFPRPMPLLIIT
jgi:hypothetical protein